MSGEHDAALRLDGDELVRFSLRIPRWLKEEIEETARDEKMSVNQIATFFLAHALRMYEGDPQMKQEMEDARVEVRTTFVREAFCLDDLRRS